ncbi:hypothetical protein V8C42DRAFT_269706 [Trichoderma barbatum]
MDFQWILPIWPKTPPSYAIYLRPTRAFAARHELHGSGKVTLALAQILPDFASHHNRSPREKGRGTQTQRGGVRGNGRLHGIKGRIVPASPKLKPMLVIRPFDFDFTSLLLLSPSQFSTVQLQQAVSDKQASWPQHLLLLLLPCLARHTHPSTRAQPTCRGADTHTDGHADDGPTDGHTGGRTDERMDRRMDSTHGRALTDHRRCHTKPNLVPTSSACVKDPKVHRPASRTYSIGAASPPTSTNIHMPMPEMQ